MPDISLKNTIFKEIFNLEIRIFFSVIQSGKKISYLFCHFLKRISILSIVFQFRVVIFLSIFFESTDKIR